jgi:hypothetical protein
MTEDKKQLLNYFEASSKDRRAAIVLSLVALLEDVHGESFAGDYLQSLTERYGDPGPAYQESELETLYSHLPANQREALLQVARCLQPRRDPSGILAASGKVYRFDDYKKARE